MAVTATPQAADRSDFRTVTVSGAKLGVATGVAVVLVVAASRGVPDVGGLRAVVEALVVLVAAVAAGFLPGSWTAARTTEGIAAAAAVGLVGTVVFTAIDITLLRPFKAYPWTWDAIGGGSSWWYLPVWWMLGTFLAWMGAIVTARAGAGEATLLRRAGPAVAGSVILAVVVRLAGLAVPLPVAVGGAFTLVLAALALVALARKG
ncbi:MAG TPA: hypothetical protein VM716_01545 [Gemmatimonadales bacterium]|nr:hypothetical protein [Gemmatimonadales bacterium]